MDNVCVLIVNYQAHEDAIAYVENLSRQEGVRLSVLIVDNCSPGDSFAVLSERFAVDPTVDVIQSEYNGGYAYGNNFGLRYLQYRSFDYVIISNSDIRLDDTGLIAAMIDEYKRLPRAAFLAPKMLVNGREDVKHQAWKLSSLADDVRASLRTLYLLADWTGQTNAYRFAPGDRRTHPVDCLSGSFFLGAKSVFYELGLFDENTFLYMEESILGQKVCRLGLANYLMRSHSYHHGFKRLSRGLRAHVRLHRHWLDSAVYYQRTFNNASPAQVMLLRALFPLWVAETAVVLFGRRVWRKGRGG
jgi:GT2 family glycosyltransferase